MSYWPKELQLKISYIPQIQQPVMALRSEVPQPKCLRHQIPKQKLSYKPQIPQTKICFSKNALKLASTTTKNILQLSNTTTNHALKVTSTTTNKRVRGAWIAHLVKRLPFKELPDNFDSKERFDRSYHKDHLINWEFLSVIVFKILAKNCKNITFRLSMAITLTSSRPTTFILADFCRP